MWLYYPSAGYVVTCTVIHIYAKSSCLHISFDCLISSHDTLPVCMIIIISIGANALLSLCCPLVVASGLGFSPLMAMAMAVRLYSSLQICYSTPWIKFIRTQDFNIVCSLLGYMGNPVGIDCGERSVWIALKHLSSYRQWRTPVWPSPTIWQTQPEHMYLYPWSRRQRWPSAKIRLHTILPSLGYQFPPQYQAVNIQYNSFMEGGLLVRMYWGSSDWWCFVKRRE